MSLAPLNLELDFEFEPPQSPPLSPEQHVANENPATPKRKREADGDNIDDCDTPSKRSSPLQQVTTPDALCLTAEKPHTEGGVGSQTQKLTPMKRSVSSQKATPVTLVKGVNRFQLDNDSSPSGGGLVNPFNIYVWHGFAYSGQPEVDRLHYHDGNEDEIDQVSATNNGATKKLTATPATPSTQRKLLTTPDNPISASQTSRPANPTPYTAITAAAPQQSSSALKKIPAIAPEYVPIYVSLDSPVKLRDSKQFCIKPPFWKRWPKHQYLALARYLEENNNLVPFAEQEGLTVEEVQHVYQAVVVEPLRVETDRLAEVGQKRIEKMFKAYNKTHGKTWRKWGDGKSSVDADLGGVKPGIVQLTGENADLIEVPFRKLNDVDKEFVLSLLPEEELAVLMKEVV
ncbi:hypothetical protein Q7P35_010512 [Cladosporium inversicolor]